VSPRVTAASSPLESLARYELPPRSLVLSWFGQASVALRLGGTTVLVDPFLSPHPERLVPPPFAAEEARGVDLVLITHDHLDHLDEAALPVLAAASPTAIVVVPEGIVERVVELGVKGTRVRGLPADGRTEIGAVTVDAVPACHGEGTADAYRMGPFLGYVVSAGGARVYHAGDTVLFDGLVAWLRELGVDLALLPINGRDEDREAQGIVGNLDAREAAQLAEAIGADAAVPLHWDMFAGNPGDPAAFVVAARTTVVVPQRSRPFIYTAPQAMR
jgi:L-ascorbate metabolism protein UlaG (beta-lactamase superfamily)